MEPTSAIKMTSPYTIVYEHDISHMTLTHQPISSVGVTRPW